MGHFADHPTHGGSVFLLDSLTDTAEANGLYRCDLSLFRPIGALGERDFKLRHFRAPFLQYVFDGLAAQSRDLFRRLQALQALNGRVDHIVGVVAAQ